jgi:hypothetical protein
MSAMDEQNDAPGRPQPPYDRLDHDPFAEQPAPLPPGAGTGRVPSGPTSGPPAAPPVPPKQQSGVWKVLAIVFGTILGLEVVAVVALFVVGVVWAVGNLVGPDVEAAVEGPCRDVAAAAAEVRVLEGARANREPLEDLAAAAGDVATAAARAAGSDAEERFAQDWRRLASALDAALEDPEAGYTVPRRDGVPLPVAMLDSSPIGCEPPPILTVLDPEATGDLVLTDPNAF